MSIKAYKFGSKKKKQYLELLREGGRRNASARAVGISVQTVCDHMKDDPEFAAAVDKAEMEAHELVEDSLFQSAQSGNVPSMIFYLCNRMPEKWINQQKIKNETDVNLRGNIDVTTAFGEVERLITRIIDGRATKGTAEEPDA